MMDMLEQTGRDAALFVVTREERRKGKRINSMRDGAAVVA